MDNKDNLSIIETGNELCKSIEELEKKARRHALLDDSGKYRCQFNGYKSPGCYVEDRSAAQALIRIMVWFHKDNAGIVRTLPMHGEVMICQPGEPDVTVAIYTMWPTGRIVRYTTDSQRRQTVHWGDEV